MKNFEWLMRSWLTINYSLLFIILMLKMINNDNIKELLIGVDFWAIVYYIFISKKNEPSLNSLQKETLNARLPKFSNFTKILYKFKRDVQRWFILFMLIQYVIVVIMVYFYFSFNKGLIEFIIDMIYYSITCRSIMYHAYQMSVIQNYLLTLSNRLQLADIMIRKQIPTFFNNQDNQNNQTERENKANEIRNILNEYNKLNDFCRDYLSKWLFYPIGKSISAIVKITLYLNYSYKLDVDYLKMCIPIGWIVVTIIIIIQCLFIEIQTNNHLDAFCTYRLHRLDRVSLTLNGCHYWIYGDKVKKFEIYGMVGSAILLLLVVILPVTISFVISLFYNELYLLTTVYLI
jgi:hypothetical protein